MPRPSLNKAFTLVEMLLGLGIFSIITLSLYGTFWGGVKLNERAEHTNSLLREARWALAQMEQDLENMVPYDFSTSYPERTAFVGQPDQIAIVVATEDGLKAVRYYLAKPSEGKIYRTIMGGRHTRQPRSIVTRYEEKQDLRLLIREEVPFVDSLQSDPEEGSTEKEVVCSHLQGGGLAISYAYQHGSAEDIHLGWERTWGEPYLPSGVRVELTLLQPDREGRVIPLKKDIFIPTGYLGEKVEKNK
jgi:prepilin-type N-terminal cleavage/methylation domain-containing protein